jgi:hypothetical protein
MDRASFWQIIESSLREASGDNETQVDCLQSALDALPVKEIVSFDQHFNALWCEAYRQDLWTALGLISKGRTELTFMDFRAWLVSRGQQVFEEVLKKPDTLALVVKKGENCEIEGFQYIALQAWEDKTGKDSLDFPATDLEHPKTPVGETWHPAEYPTKLPLLWERFGAKPDDTKPKPKRKQKATNGRPPARKGKPKLKGQGPKKRPK